MEKIEKYVLPDYMNELFKDEAHTFLSLTVDCANKINELIEAFNSFNKTDEVSKLNQNERINGAVRYMKDNLQSSLKELTATLIDTGYFDSKIEEHCQSCNKIEEHCNTCEKCNNESQPETIEKESNYLIRKDGGGTLHIYRLCNKGYIRYTLEFELVSELIYLSSISLCDFDLNVIQTLSKSDNAIDGYVELSNGVRYGGTYGCESGDSGMNYYIVIDGQKYSLQGSFNAVPETECNYIMIVTDTWIESGSESIANRIKRLYFKENGCLEISNQYIPLNATISKLSSGSLSLPKSLINHYTADDDIFLYSVHNGTNGNLRTSLENKSILLLGNGITVNHITTSNSYKRTSLINADSTHIHSDFADMDDNEIAIDTPHTIQCVIKFEY